jgi:hypothetical protein
MLCAAHNHGLRILDGDGDYYRKHANVDDKLYDSRAGLGVFYRWKPRDMRSLCESQEAGFPPVIHVSALERIAHGTDGYNPGTLAHQTKITFTRSNHRDQIKAAAEDTAAGLRTRAVTEALQQAFAKRGADFDTIRYTLALGRLSYYVYVLACAGVLLAACVPDVNSIAPWAILKSAAILVYNIVTGQWGLVLESAKRVLTTPWMVGVLLCAFALSAALGAYVDRVRSKTFSRFWHTSRQELRTALKGAKAIAAASS